MSGSVVGWLRAARASLLQAPLKLTLGLLGQGSELEEDIPDPEEMDWWSKYYASLQELQGQVGGAGLHRNGGAKDGGVSSSRPCVLQSSWLQPSLLLFGIISVVGH